MAGFPKSLGECIDLSYTLRAERKEVEAKAEKMKEKEKMLEDHIFSKFENAEIDGAKGKLASASRKMTTSAKVTDPEKFFAWVAKAKAWEFLWKSANLTACKERWEAKEVVPGVDPVHVMKLHINKIG